MARANAPILLQSNHERRRVQLFALRHPQLRDLPHDIALLLADAESYAAHPEEHDCENPES